MSSRRALIIGVAAVLGLVAAAMVVIYLRGIEREAYDDARLVRVYLVKKAIDREFPGDTALAEEYIVQDRIPQKFRPLNALTDLSTIKGKVALAPLSPNQVLVEGHFVDPRIASVSFSQQIDQGLVAVTVNVDSVRGVANLLVAGDRVNLMVTGPEGEFRHLYQNVRVIAIGNTPAPQPGETQAATNPGSGLITFGVPPEAAAKIALASQPPNSIYLTLLPPDYQPAPVPAASQANLYTGGLTPYPGE